MGTLPRKRRFSVLLVANERRRRRRKRVYVTDFFVSKYRAQSNQISNKQQSLN